MKCPVIETVAEAIAMGQALADVLHYDRGWVERVFQGDPTINYQTGPAVLNRELQSQWELYWTRAEQEAILTKFVAYRLT